MLLPNDPPVLFADMSAQFSHPNTTNHHRALDVPNPQFLAIHAAIGGILQMSGASAFFDRLLDDYSYEDSMPVIRWEDLERAETHKEIRESVLSMMGSLNNGLVQDA